MERERQKGIVLGIFRPLSGDIFACAICNASEYAINVRDKKDKKGLVHYKSSVGTSAFA